MVSSFNFFQRVSVSSGTFSAAPNVNFGFQGNPSFSLINGGSGIVEYSFDGSTLCGDLVGNGAQGSALVFNQRGYSSIWFRLKSGAISEVRVEATEGTMSLGAPETVNATVTFDGYQSVIVTNNVSTIKLPRIARAVFMASATLPASGAYTTTSAYAIPDGVQFVTFYITYTRGASGGFAKFKCNVGNGTDAAATVQTLDPSITVSQPNGLQLTYNSELNGPKPQDGNALSFVYTFATRGGETLIALQAAELGQTGTPGTCAIGLTAGY